MGGTVIASLSLTDDLADELAEQVAAGVPLRTAARAAGLGETTVYQWLQAADSAGAWPQTGTPIAPDSQERIERFAAKIAAAQAQFEAAQVRAIREDAEVVNARTQQRDWRARAWLLNNHPATRDTYRQAQQVNVIQSGTVTHALELVKDLSVEQLRELAGQDLPALPGPTNTGDQTP